jgi:hypothetical protein
MKYFDNVRVKGFDTETYRGNLKVITAMSTTNDIAVETANNTFHPEGREPIELFDWLYKNAVEYNFFYNIKFDWSIIIKPFITDTNNKDIRGGEFIIGRYLISYIQGKSFSIKLTNSTNTKGHKYKSRFYSIDNFFKPVGGALSLDNAAKSFLNSKKNNEELGIEREKIGKIKGYYESNKALIDKYCRNDSLLTAQLGELFKERLFEILKKYPQSLNSSASISKAYMDIYFKEKNSYWNLLKDKPEREKIHSFINNSFHGGIFHLYRIGRIDDVKEIDLNSAYPYEITKLKTLVGAEIKHVTEYTEADYGFYKVKMAFPSAYPFPFRLKNMVTYPISSVVHTDYITAVEYNFLKSKGVQCDIIEGYVITTKDIKPFQSYNELYKLKSELKEEYKTTNDITELILSDQYKYLMNASYGSFAESKNGYTEFSNMIFASYITANTRIKIYEALDLLRKNGCEPIAIMTDAIMYRGKWDYPSSNKLGDFKIEIFDDKTTANAVIYMNGLYMVNGKWRATRGFPSLVKEKDDFNKASGNTYTIKRNKPLGLKEGIIQKKIPLIGDWVELIKNIKLDTLYHKYDIDIDLNFEWLRENNIDVHHFLHYSRIIYKYLDITLPFALSTTESDIPINLSLYIFSIMSNIKTLSYK